MPRGELRSYGNVFDDVAAEVRRGSTELSRPSSSMPPRRRARSIANRACSRSARGTGKLTELLVGRGLHVHAIEPGAI